VVVHENVPQFWEELLHRHLGGHYYICSFILDSAMVGFQLISRVRRYTVLYHRAKVRVTRSPTEMLTFLASAVQYAGIGATAISDCFLATAEELCAEIWPLCVRRGVNLNDALRNMTLLLTEDEYSRLQLYLEHWQVRFGCHASQCPSAVFNLCDNPASGRVTWSAASGRIPGLRTNAGKLWSPMLQRWLTTKELLAAMGLPVYPALAAAAGVPLLEVQPGAEARHMLGNMMHIASVGTAMLIALSCARPL